MKKQFRQGDILLRQVNKLPKGAILKSAKQVVLARGETTGHAHVLTGSRVEFFEDKNGDLWLNVLSPDALLTHEEHAPIAVAPAIYHVVRQREYTPQEIRRVTD